MSVEHYIFSENVNKLEVVEDTQLAQHADKNTVRVVLTSGDEHVFYGSTKEHTGYRVRDGALEIGLQPDYPSRTYGPTAWAYAEGNFSLLRW